MGKSSTPKWIWLTRSPARRRQLQTIFFFPGWEEIITKAAPGSRETRTMRPAAAADAVSSWLTSRAAAVNGPAHSRNTNRNRSPRPRWSDPAEVTVHRPVCASKDVSPAGGGSPTAADRKPPGNSAAGVPAPARTARAATVRNAAARKGVPVSVVFLSFSMRFPFRFYVSVCFPPASGL